MYVPRPVEIAHFQNGELQLPQNSVYPLMDDRLASQNTSASKALSLSRLYQLHESLTLPTQRLTIGAGLEMPPEGVQIRYSDSSVRHDVTDGDSFLYFMVNMSLQSSRRKNLKGNKDFARGSKATRPPG